MNLVVKWMAVVLRSADILHEIHFGEAVAITQCKFDFRFHLAGRGLINACSMAPHSVLPEPRRIIR